MARETGLYIDVAVGVPYERNETFLIGPDGRQRLVDLMGDGCRELPQRRHARDARKLGLRLMERLLDLVCVNRRGDVGGDTAVAEEATPRIKQGPPARGNVDP